MNQCCSWTLSKNLFPDPFESGFNARDDVNFGFEVHEIHFLHPRRYSPLAPLLSNIFIRFQPGFLRRQENEFAQVFPLIRLDEIASACYGLAIAR